MPVKLIPSLAALLGYDEFDENTGAPIKKPVKKKQRAAPGLDIPGVDPFKPRTAIPSPDKVGPTRILPSSLLDARVALGETLAPKALKVAKPVIEGVQAAHANPMTRPYTQFAKTSLDVLGSTGDATAGVVEAVTDGHPVTSLETARRGGEALVKGVQGEHKSVADVLRTKGLELGPVTGLGVDMVTDLANFVPGKALLAAAGPLAIPLKLGGKLDDAARAAAKANANAIFAKLAPEMQREMASFGGAIKTAIRDGDGEYLTELADEIAARRGTWDGAIVDEFLRQIDDSGLSGKAGTAVQGQVEDMADLAATLGYDETAVDIAGKATAKPVKPAKPLGRAIPEGRAVYHGSTKPFADVMDLSKADEEALYGPGEYFTEASRISDGYAGRYDTPIRPEQLEDHIGRDFRIGDNSDGSHRLVSVRRISEPDSTSVWGDLEATFAKGNGEEVKILYPTDIDSAGRPKIRKGGDARWTHEPRLESYEPGANVRKAELGIKNAFDIDDYKIDEVENIVSRALDEFLPGLDPEKRAMEEQLAFRTIEAGEQPSHHDVYEWLEDLADNAQRTAGTEIEAPVSELLKDSDRFYTVNGSRIESITRLDGGKQVGLKLASYGSEQVFFADEIVRLGTAPPVAPKKAVNDFLMKLGYDGITHIGGGRTGNKAHQVWIALKPGLAKAPWGTQIGAVTPGAVSTLGGAAVGAATGAAMNQDGPGGIAAGAAAGAVAGAAGAAGLVKLAKALPTMGNTMATAAAKVAEETRSAQPYVEHLIKRVKERPEALGVTTNVVETAAPKAGTVRGIEEEARFANFLERLGVKAGSDEHNMVSHIMADGARFFEHRRMSQSWSKLDALSWEKIFRGVNLPKGAILNAEDTEALKRGIVGLNQYASDIANHVTEAQAHLQAGRLNDAKLIWDGYDVSSQRALEGLADQAMEEAVIGWRSLTSVRSEQGRALNALKKRTMYKALGKSDDAFIEAASALGSTGAETRQALTQLTDPVARYKFLRNRAKVTGTDLIKWHLYTSLLSNIKTHGKNVISNKVNILSQDVGFLIGRTIDAARGGVSPAQLTEEAKLLYQGQIKGIFTGWAAAMDVLKRGFTDDAALAFAEKPPEIKPSDIGIGSGGADTSGAIGALNAVSRFLEASDQFSRTISMSGALHVEGYRNALNLVKKGKLRKDQIETYVREFVEDPLAIDEKAWERAARVASHSVYRQEPGRGTQLMLGIQQWLDTPGRVVAEAASNIKSKPLRLAAYAASAPLHIGTWAMPFVRTPAGVFRRQFQAMGGGLYSAWKSGKEGATTLSAMQKGEAALGLAMLYPLFLLARAGYITGTGPDNPHLVNPETGEPTRDKSMDMYYAEKTPASINVKGVQVDYRLLGPAAGPLALVGNLAEAERQHGKLDETAFFQGAWRYARSMLSNSFLTTAMGLFEGIMDETGTSGRTTIGRTVTGFVPLSGALRAARSWNDDVLRDTSDKSLRTTVANNLKGLTPGLSTEVPARVDFAGEIQHQANPGTSLTSKLVRTFNPFDVRYKQPDPVRQELAKAGIGAYFVKPPKGLKDELGNPMDLSQLQSVDLQQKVGFAQRNIAERLLEMPGFRDLPVEARAKILREQMHAARDIAKKQFRAEIRSKSTAKP